MNLINFNVFINFRTWTFNSIKGENATMGFCEYTVEGYR